MSDQYFALHNSESRGRKPIKLIYHYWLQLILTILYQIMIYNSLITLWRGSPVLLIKHSLQQPRYILQSLYTLTRREAVNSFIWVVSILMNFHKIYILIHFKGISNRERQFLLKKKDFFFWKTNFFKTTSKKIKSIRIFKETSFLFSFCNTIVQ